MIRNMLKTTRIKKKTNVKNVFSCRSSYLYIMRVDREIVFLYQLCAIYIGYLHRLYSPNKILGPLAGRSSIIVKMMDEPRAQWPTVELFSILFPTSAPQQLTFFIFGRTVCLLSRLIVFDKKPEVLFIFLFFIYPFHSTSPPRIYVFSLRNSLFLYMCNMCR